jgi:hypothetical protein
MSKLPPHLTAANTPVKYSLTFLEYILRIHEIQLHKGYFKTVIRVSVRGLPVTVVTPANQRQPQYNLVNKANLVHNFS